ncbi:MAG TPA: hypothetical protein VJR94_07920 [Candidatus Nitrosocosmicus sp.]|nr:hypothetical protein [Candidatus Nitrosocosmicus sp.]
MSLSTCEHISRELASKIINLDTELMAKMYGKNLQPRAIYQIFSQRLSLYEKACAMPLTEIDRLLLDSKKANVAMELRMFRLEHIIEEEVSQIISRLEIRISIF